MTASCIYQGTVRHRRAEPRREFTHRLALAYVDLDELPALLGGALADPRPGLVRFRRADYLGDPRVPLDSSVRERVQELTGIPPDGPIRVLTQLRSFGHCFNPVSFYFCMEAGGQGVEALLADVTNTPWGERHSYAIERGATSAAVISGRFRKAMHVSPFMEMDRVYSLRAGTPGEILPVHIESLRDGQPVFDATLALRRRELTRASLAAVTARYPFASLRALALIYGHALALRLSGLPTHPHPARSQS